MRSARAARYRTYDVCDTMCVCGCVCVICVMIRVRYSRGEGAASREERQRVARTLAAVVRGVVFVFVYVRIVL